MSHLDELIEKFGVTDDDVIRVLHEALKDAEGKVKQLEQELETAKSAYADLLVNSTEQIRDRDFIIAAKKAVIEDGRRLTRELDQACFGDDAAEQASLCDLKKAIPAELDRLRKALHEISLCSQNSMSSKDECGRIARAAIKGDGDGA